MAGQFAEPLVDGRLDRLGEQIARPEHLDEPERDRGADQAGLKLAAGLHEELRKGWENTRIPRRELAGKKRLRRSFFRHMSTQRLKDLNPVGIELHVRGPLSGTSESR